MSSLLELQNAIDARDWTSTRAHYDFLENSDSAKFHEFIQMTPSASPFATTIMAAAADLHIQKHGGEMPSWADNLAPLKEMPKDLQQHEYRLSKIKQLITPFMKGLGLLLGPENFFPIRNNTKNGYLDTWNDKEWITSYLNKSSMGLAA